MLSWSHIPWDLRTRERPRHVVALISQRPVSVADLKRVRCIGRRSLPAADESNVTFAGLMRPPLSESCRCDQKPAPTLSAGGGVQPLPASNGTHPSIARHRQIISSPLLMATWTA